MENKKKEVVNLQGLIEALVEDFKRKLTEILETAFGGTDEPKS